LIEAIRSPFVVHAHENNRGDPEMATGDATSSIVAISWVGPPLTFKITLTLGKEALGIFERLQRLPFRRVEIGH
jgi:hypothetical protein